MCSVQGGFGSGWLGRVTRWLRKYSGSDEVTVRKVFVYPVARGKNTRRLGGKMKCRKKEGAG